MSGRTWEGGEIPSLGEIREVSTEGGLDIQNSLGLEQEGQCHTTHTLIAEEGIGPMAHTLETFLFPAPV